MALVIETGEIVASANSFVERSEIIAYAAERGVTMPDTDATDFCAVQAIDYIWAQCLKGKLVSDAQTVPFPRKGLVEGDDASDYTYSIPFGIKRAQMQLALDAFNGVLLTASSTPAGILKRSKVGPIEREFQDVPVSMIDTRPPLTVAKAWLAPFLCNDGAVTLRTVRV